jgi:hypothetical protein
MQQWAMQDAASISEHNNSSRSTSSRAFASQPPAHHFVDRIQLAGMRCALLTKRSIYIERQNLSMRMGMRRFTRLTRAFSKKLENHMRALSIYFMHYNFVRIPQTPAMHASDGSGLLTGSGPLRISSLSWTNGRRRHEGMKYCSLREQRGECNVGIGSY